MLGAGARRLPAVSPPPCLCTCLHGSSAGGRVVHSVSSTISTSDTRVSSSGEPSAALFRCQLQMRAPSSPAHHLGRDRVVFDMPQDGGRPLASGMLDPFAAARDRQAGSRDGLDRRLLPVPAISSDDDETPEAGLVPAAHNPLSRSKTVRRFPNHEMTVECPSRSAAVHSPVRRRMMTMA